MVEGSMASTNMTSSNHEMLFLTVARQTADATDNIFVGQTELFTAALQSKGMSEKKTLETYRALKRNGHISPFRDLDDIDVFKITPKGLKWFLMQQYGTAKYRTMVDEIVRPKELVKGLAVVAERLKLPVSVVQEILYAEEFK